MGMDPIGMEDLAIIMTVPEMPAMPKMGGKRGMEIGPQAAPQDAEELLAQIYKMLQCHFDDDECGDEQPMAKPSKPKKGKPEEEEEPEEGEE